MALIDKDTARFLGGGIVGAGAMVLWPYVGPVAIALARPLLKSIIRQSVLGLEHGRERFARATETLEDVVAEVRMELEEEREAHAAAAGHSAGAAASSVAGGNGSGASS